MISYFSGGSSHNKAIIGGIAGGVGLIFILLALVILYLLSNKKKVAQRGNSRSLPLGGNKCLTGIIFSKYKSSLNMSSGKYFIQYLIRINDNLYEY